MRLPHEIATGWILFILGRDPAYKKYQLMHPKASPFEIHRTIYVLDGHKLIFLPSLGIVHREYKPSCQSYLSNITDVQ